MINFFTDRKKNHTQLRKPRHRRKLYCLKFVLYFFLAIHTASLLFHAFFCGSKSFWLCNDFCRAHRTHVTRWWSLWCSADDDYLVWPELIFRLIFSLCSQVLLHAPKTNTHILFNTCKCGRLSELYNTLIRVRFVGCDDVYF